MGSGQYSQDIAYSSRASGVTISARTAGHPTLDPKVGPREVNNETPIVLALDVTRSRGDDTRRLYAQLPTLMKKLEERNYVAGPGISFAAVGDADADRAPLQVGQFEADNRLDAVLANMWIEEGGGGTGQESYELAAWYYAGTNCVRLAAGQGGKGFFFFVGDEGFYPTVSGAHREKVLGQPAEDLPAAAAFAALQQKFHTFLLYPASSMNDRKADIDAEIRARVVAAGGQHDNVDVRISLIWDNRNDLDLHVITPGNHRIYFGSKQSPCGGMLDVDRNVSGETSTPVENTRWAKGAAPDGTYRVIVRNFRFHEPNPRPTPFRVEIEVGGELLYHEGIISPGLEVGPPSDIELPAFTFSADAASRAAQYEAYSDAVVLQQWSEVLPAGHILRLADAQNISLALIGALAIAQGKETLASYAARLREEGVAAAAVADLEGALGGLRRLT